MTLIDYESSIIGAVWDALEANNTPGNAFKDRVLASNRIKLYTPVGDDEDPDDGSEIKTSWNDGDFPEVTVSLPIVQDTFYTIGTGKSYTAGPGRFNPAAINTAVELMHSVAIDVVHVGSNFTQSRKLIDLIMRCLRAAGPTLGVTAFRVQRVGPFSRTNRIQTTRVADFGDPNGTRRIVTNIALPVIVRAQSTELL